MRSILRAVPAILVVSFGIPSFAGCGNNIPPKLKLDQTWCDIKAIPCQQYKSVGCCKSDMTCDPTCSTYNEPGSCPQLNCQNPPCLFVKCIGTFIDPDSITNVPIQCPFDPKDLSGPLPVTGVGGATVCFDHTKQTAAEACQAECTAGITSKILRPSWNYPMGTNGLLRKAPQNGGGCSGTVNMTTGNGHDQVPNTGYFANICSVDPLNDLLFATRGTDIVTLSGGGTATLSGVGSTPVAIKGGLFNLAAPFTTCNSMQASCPLQINQVEIDFDDFKLNGHSIDGLQLISRAATLTASGVVSGGFFTFKTPQGIPWDAVATFDGTFTGVTGTSQMVDGSIDLNTGKLTFQFDVMGTFNGKTLEASGTATTANLIALAPVVTAGSVTMTDLTNSCAASVTVTASASSHFNLPVTIDYFLNNKPVGSGSSATTTLAIGSSYTFIITGTDTGGMSDEITKKVTPIDTLGPVVTTIRSPITLWPPNHDYATITLDQCVTSVVDQCDGSLDAMTHGQITNVTANEQADDLGSGNTCNDIVISSNNTVKLRAERDGGGQGRVYTIHFTESDLAGNKTPATCVVQVPHDQSGAPATNTPPVMCVGSSCGNIPGPHC